MAVVTVLNRRNVAITRRPPALRGWMYSPYRR